MDCGNISEVSESSYDEVLRDYFGNFIRNSDLDDIEKIIRLLMFIILSFILLVELDFVNESIIFFFRF